MVLKPVFNTILIRYQLQVDQNKLFYVDFVHNLGKDLFRLRNLNAASEYEYRSNECNC
jgi:hypothetical protein